MALVIPEPRLIQTPERLFRVTSTIAGQEIYFESSEPLSPRVEAFVCALTLPAMSRGLNLDVRAPLSLVMIENLRRARTMVRQWWPHFRGGELRAPVAPVRPRAAGKGLFFTGGVDSTFALYHLRNEVSRLLFVEGFDVKLDDTPRLRRVRNSLQRVAAATGHRLTFLRTNLREHRLFNKVHWEIAHIAAMAAVAHVCGDRLGTVYVADSDVPPPYGSHPDLDKLWSSGSVALVNFGVGHSRLQRVAAICQWAPPREHLRVCWENLSETLNCGRCKKCLLTRLQLLAAGDPTGMDSFPGVPLVETLEHLVKSDPGTYYPHFWREIQPALADPRLRDLIETLLSHHPPSTLMKYIKMQLKRLLQALSPRRKSDRFP